MKIFDIFRRKTSSLEERVNNIEILLAGDDMKPASSNWSYRDIRQILDRTDLGKSPDFYTGSTLKERLSVIEGCIDILHSAHMGHTNFDGVEFKDMHGFSPTKLKGDLLKRIDGMQKKLDLIVSLFEDMEITMTGKDALRLIPK